MLLRYFTKDNTYPFFIQYGKHDEDLYVHTHIDFTELVIVLNGSATHIVDKEQFHIKKGDVFVINKNTSHGYQDTNNLRICNIMYGSDFFLSSDYDITKSAGYHALFMLEPYFVKEHKFNSRLTLDFVEFEKIHAMTEIMLAEYNAKTDGWKTLIQSTFLSLVVKLSRLYSMSESSDKNDMINLAKAVSLIENHFIDDLSVHKLAEISNYSERHFIRIFRDTYNSTPLEYIITLRIHYACTLLRKSKASITTIALQCGFKDSNYFSRVFKKRMGCTPREYRLHD